MVAIALGLAVGAEIDIVAYLTTRYFGFRRYGVIYGWLYGMFIFGTGVGPPLMGAVFDSSRV